MSDKTKVWIDPHGRALRFLDDIERQRKEEAEQRHKEEIERQQREAERQRREEAKQQRRQERAMKRESEKKAAKTQALTTQVEILPPETKVRDLAPPDATADPGLDLADFERQIRDAAKMLNLAEPEGFLDRLFDRPDHRIEVKTERGHRLARYISACGAMVEAARGLQGARRQAYLDQVTFLLRIAEHQLNMEAVTDRFRLQKQIEEAKAREIIADQEAKIREHSLRGIPVPPPPPPQPAAAPKVDEDEVKRQTAQKARKLESDLKLDAVEAEMDHQDKLVATALTRIQKIFGEPQTLRSAKRSRILNLRDTYGIDDSLLPAGVLELLEEE